MTRSNRALVGEAMDILKDGLAPFVHSRFKVARRTPSSPAHLMDTLDLLKTMDSSWYPVFRPTLGRMERSLVNELHETRNRWAHQEQFSNLDTYRALDSAHRLMTAIDSPLADEIQKLKMEWPKPSDRSLPDQTQSEPDGEPIPSPISPTFSINDLMDNLAKTRPIFFQESSFRDALAQRIRESYPNTDVRMEFDPGLGSPMRLDLWLPTEGIAIELKYPTQELDVEYDGERFALKEHSAQDLTRYDYLKDIQRLEQVVSDYESAKRGFAILLTNDSLYWRPTPAWETRNDAAFRIHEGRTITGEMAWGPKAGSGTTRNREAPILLRGSYNLRWQDYSTLSGGGQHNQFKYIAIEVEPGV